MNLECIKQSMLKQAAFGWFPRLGGDTPQDSSPTEPVSINLHGRVYDNLKDFEAAGFGGDLMESAKAKGNAPWSFTPYPGTQRNGYIQYTYKRPGVGNAGTNGIVKRLGDTITAGWNKLFPQRAVLPPQPGSAANALGYTIYPPASVNAGSEGINFTIYPKELASTEYNQAMIEAMNHAKGLDSSGSYQIPEKQPLTIRQSMAYHAGDSEYFDKLLEHWRSIDPKFRHEGNLILSNDNELVALGNTIPAVQPADYMAGYNPFTGEIKSLSDDALQEMHEAYSSESKQSGEPRSANASRASGIYSSAHTPEALSGDVYNHELNHLLTLGTLDVKNEPFTHFENVPAGLESSSRTSGQNAAWRRETPTALYFTPIQKEWLLSHEIEPYALDEGEINQALLAFNEGRYRLRKHMLENPNNQNYVQLAPELRQQFADLPQFIQGGQKGAEELDKVMDFYGQNPQFIPLMGEQARLVGYYYNLKAARDNSTDPAEKAFFQNLMNRMIYSKSFLANTQRPSYIDVQRMRA